MTDEMATGIGEVILEIVTQAMEVGYLYGKSEDGHIYKVKAPMPKPGETIFMPLMHMPKDGVDG